MTDYIVWTRKSKGRSRKPLCKFQQGQLDECLVAVGSGKRRGGVDLGK